MNAETPFIMAAYYDSDSIADPLATLFFATFPAEGAFDNWTCIWVIVVGDTSAADVSELLSAFIAR